MARREDRRFYDRWYYESWRPWYRRNRVETWGIILLLAIIIAAWLLARAVRSESRPMAAVVSVSSTQLRELSTAYAGEVAALTARVNVLEEQNALLSIKVDALTESVHGLSGTVSNMNLMIEELMKCSCRKAPKRPPHRRVPTKPKASLPSAPPPPVRRDIPPLRATTPLPVPAPREHVTVIREHQPVEDMPKTVCPRPTRGRSACDTR